MGMKAMTELKEMLCEELEKLTKKGELSAGSLDAVHKLTDTIKNIDKIMVLEEEAGYSERGGMGGNRGGYSEAGDWEARGRFGGNSYDDGGSSYANRRRDSRGRYSREGGYSRADGKMEMVENLKEMMQEADGPMKHALKRAIEEIEMA